MLPVSCERSVGAGSELGRGPILFGPRMLEGSAGGAALVFGSKKGGSAEVELEDASVGDWPVGETKVGIGGLDGAGGIEGSLEGKGGITGWFVVGGALISQGLDEVLGAGGVGTG